MVPADKIFLDTSAAEPGNDGEGAFPAGKIFHTTAVGLGNDGEGAFPAGKIFLVTAKVEVKPGNDGAGVGFDTFHLLVRMP